MPSYDYSGWRISFTFNQAGLLGDKPTGLNVLLSCSRFAELATVALRDAFPGAAVRVDLDAEEDLLVLNPAGEQVREPYFAAIDVLEQVICFRKLEWQVSDGSQPRPESTTELPIARPETRYTEAQQRAIDIIDQNLQIIACAGSGKTRVVAARIINILKQHATDGISPENIVAFTFTEKAAAELKDRITRLYQSEFGNVEGIAGMYIGTIHGFCLDMLQRFLFQYLKYDVLDEVKQRLFIDRNHTRSGMASLGLRRYIESDLYITLLRIMREANADATLLENHPVRRALETYQALLNSHSYFDYDEILSRAVTELKTNHRLRDQIGDRIKYLTIDEYQDVNPIQEMLIREMHDLGVNVCVVGDDDQNIYQWRGSDVRHILRFADRYPDVVQVPLELNFRSTPAVIEVARRSVEINHNRLPKAMQSGSDRVYERGDLLALKFDSPDAEAEWIAHKINSLRYLAYSDGGRVRGLAWSDCAILLRSVRNCAGPIVATLEALGIPYIVSGLAGLFGTAEIQAVEGLFKFIVHDIDERQIRTLWHAAELGLGDEDLDYGVSLLKDRRNFGAGKRFSTYNIQRTYLDFLEAIQLREERIPHRRGEVVYYNLGKFSQVISDYEEIHFKSQPEEKYRSFVDFLQYQAPSYYPEGGQDAAYATPDAVRIMTVHQAKGMEFPVVFLPCLQKNRFPAMRRRSPVWNRLPREGIRNADRYDTGDEDERRLFYVALTRSEKYLFCSWAPHPTNRLYQKSSIFWDELTHRPQFLTREPPDSEHDQLPPEPRRPLVNVELSFSDLKYLFECPYQFKLRMLYGFNPPIHEALGYGRSLHNALAEVHRRALRGEPVTDHLIPQLLERHLHVRFAYPDLEEALRRSAEQSLQRYLRDHGSYLDRLIHAEETVQLNLPSGIVVNGRIDLIKRTDTNETIVVDFKSTEGAQAENVSRLQLHVYALGFEQRFGHRADLVEIHNLDHGGSLREPVDDVLTAETIAAVTEAGDRLRTSHLDRLAAWCRTCAECDLVGICRTKPAPVVVA